MKMGGLKNVPLYRDMKTCPPTSQCTLEPGCLLSQEHPDLQNLSLVSVIYLNILYKVEHLPFTGWHCGLLVGHLGCEKRVRPGSNLSKSKTRAQVFHSLATCPDHQVSLSWVALSGFDHKLQTKVSS